MFIGNYHFCGKEVLTYTERCLFRRRARVRMWAIVSTFPEMLWSWTPRDSAPLSSSAALRRWKTGQGGLPPPGPTGRIPGGCGGSRTPCRRQGWLTGTPWHHRPWCSSHHSPFSWISKILWSTKVAGAWWWWPDFSIISKKRISQTSWKRVLLAQRW